MRYIYVNVSRKTDGSPGSEGAGDGLVLSWWGGVFFPRSVLSSLSLRPTGPWSYRVSTVVGGG